MKSKSISNMFSAAGHEKQDLMPKQGHLIKKYEQVRKVIVF
jgi:hypothetical protein